MGSGRVSREGNPDHTCALGKGYYLGWLLNDITKDVVFYTTTSRFVPWLEVFSQERQNLWLSKDVLQDFTSWSSPPSFLLRDIHNSLLSNNDCKLNWLYETYIVWGEDDSNVTVIPAQNRLTHQILIMWQSFKGLKQTFVVSCRVEQIRLCAQ
jgi:hypothetical protein